MKNHKFLLGVLLLIINCLTLSYGYNFHGCAMAPNSDQGWVVTIESTLAFHTWNRGVNWEPVNIPTTRDFFDVFFLDSLNGWTANRLAMIWHTSDGGLNWHWQSLGMSKFGTRVFFLDTLYGWEAGGEAIVIRTTDGGSNWQQVIINYLPANIVDFYGVSFVDHMKGWMCAGRYPELDTGGHVIFKQGQGYIVHSEDGGDSWVLQRRDTIYDFFDVKFKDELEGWVVGGNDSTMEAGVLHTTNGGQTWNTQLLPMSAKYLRALELIDGNKLWAVGRNGTIIYSSNGGNSWSVQTSSVDTTLFDIDFSDSLRGLIAGNDIVLYTQNGGRNWYPANLVLPTPPILIHPENGAMRNDPIVSLVWHRSPSRVCYYTLQYADNPQFIGPISQDSLADTTYAIPTSLIDNTYYWRVKVAIDSFGNRGGWSPAFSFEIDTQSPTIPTLLEPIGNAWRNNPVVFRWSQVSFKNFDSPVNYIIQVDTIRNFLTPLVVDTTTINQHSISLNEKRYFWRVRAYDLAGNQGNFSSEDSFRVDATAPSIPILIAPPNDTTIVDSTVDLIWHRSQDYQSGMSNYQVQVSIDAYFITLIRNIVLPDTFCRFVLPDTLYYWRVRANDLAGNRSNWSSVWNFRLYRPPWIEETQNLEIPNATRAYPNPFQKNTAIQIPEFLNSSLELRIYDATGKLIKSLSKVPRSSSIITSLTWDGRDNQGKEVRPGIYFVIPEQASNKKLRLVKIK